MYFFIIRILVLLIVYFSLYLFQKKKGTTSSKRSKKAVFIKAAAGILILAIVFIPYEAPFIRFDSAEASVRYLTVNYNAPIKTVETDNTAFCISHRDNNWGFHAVTKFDKKYSFCDRHSKTMDCFNSGLIDDSSFHGIIYATKLVNNDTNEKCYMIVFLSIDLKDTEDICIYDVHNSPIEKITFPDKRSVFALVVKQIDEKSAFIFNGKTYELN